MITGAEMESKMQEFYDSHPDAANVLAAYSHVDPFHCYYGDDVNPDEYMGYAKRFLFPGTPPFQPFTRLDRVKASFHESQWHERWINESDCEKIASMIQTATGEQQLP